MKFWTEGGVLPLRLKPPWRPRRNQRTERSRLRPSAGSRLIASLSPSPALRCPQPRLDRWRGPAASLRSCPSRPQTIPRFLLHLNVVGAGNISVSLRQLSDSSSAETHSGTLRFFLLADAGFELRTDLGSADLTVDSTFGTPSTKEGRQVFKVAGRSSSLMPFRERSSFARARPTRPRPAPKSRPECARRRVRPPPRPRGE